MSKTNRRIVEEFLDLINREKKVREAFEIYAHEDYLQHNPTCEVGREGAIKLIEQIVAMPGFNPSVKRLIVEDDLVVSHMHLDFGPHAPGLAVADIWRVEDGKLIEHWDVIQEVPAVIASGCSMF